MKIISWIWFIVLSIAAAILGAAALANLVSLNFGVMIISGIGCLIFAALLHETNN